MQEDHPGVGIENAFRVSVIAPHTSAFTRQLQEAYLIKSFSGGTLLNTKYEYHHGIIPTLTSSDKYNQLQPEAPQIKSHQRIIDQQIYFEEKKQMLLREREVDESDEKYARPMK